MVFFWCGITVEKFEDDLLQAQITKVIPEILQKICQRYIGEGSVFQTIPKFKVSSRGRRLSEKVPKILEGSESRPFSCMKNRLVFFGKQVSSQLISILQSLKVP